MYVRPSQKPEDVTAVHELIRAHPFATLVGPSPQGLIASHLPFLFEPARGPHGTLFAHMARANPHAALLGNGEEMMVIVMGPHAYISPSWYADRATAPTWNYAAAHCYGVPRVHDPAETEQNIRNLIDAMEEHREHRWRIDEIGDDVNVLLPKVVSFEMELTRIEGKFKMSQGEKPERNRAAIAELEAAGEQELAGMMRKYNRLE